MLYSPLVTASDKYVGSGYDGPKPHSDFSHRPHIRYSIDFSPIERERSNADFPRRWFLQHGEFSPSLDLSLYVVVTYLSGVIFIVRERGVLVGRN